VGISFFIKTQRGPRRGETTQQGKIIRRISPKSPSVAEQKFFSATAGDFGFYRRELFCFFCTGFTLKRLPS
jgi:hypothetical protein